MIVADGIRYALALGAGAILLTYLNFWWLAGLLYFLAAFCLFFFRDPERTVPSGPVAVSPADGKVVQVKAESPTETRVSIFLNIFDVHVNRSPIGGVVREVRYQKGAFHFADREICSTENEMNVLTVEDPGGSRVVFKQIAGLIARRIVCYKKVGDTVATGERIGLIKFGSRMDIHFGPEWEITVTPGMRVAAGSSIIARRKDKA